MNECLESHFSITLKLHQTKGILKTSSQARLASHCLPSAEMAHVCQYPQQGFCLGSHVDCPWTPYGRQGWLWNSHPTSIPPSAGIIDACHLATFGYQTKCSTNARYYTCWVASLAQVLNFYIIFSVCAQDTGNQN